MGKYCSWIITGARVVDEGGAVVAPSTEVVGVTVTEAVIYDEQSACCVPREYAWLLYRKMDN